MGIMDSIKGQFIDIVEWTSTDSGILAVRFDRRDNEIKMGAQLVVREGQRAIFVKEGKMADAFAPGMYTLSTRNLPILSDLYGWKHGFSSPFKAEVYFINMLTLSNRKWGTSNPVMLRDADLGVIRLRAFGTFAYAVEDAARFFQASVGTLAVVHAHDVETQLKSLVVGALSDTLGEAGIPAFDLAAKYHEIGELTEKALAAKFDLYGLKARQFVVENISLPAEVEALIDKRSGMGVVGDIDQYMKFNLADKAGEAIAQPGGLAGTLAGAGLCLAVGGQLASNLPSAAPQKPGAMPPPLPTEGFFVAIGGQQAGPFNLTQIKQMAVERKVDRDSLVWKEGMAAWAAAASLPDVAAVFAGVPPKLP